MGEGSEEEKFFDILQANAMLEFLKRKERSETQINGKAKQQDTEKGRPKLDNVRGDKREPVQLEVSTAFPRKN